MTSKFVISIASHYKRLELKSVQGSSLLVAMNNLNKLEWLYEGHEGAKLKFSEKEETIEFTFPNRKKESFDKNSISRIAGELSDYFSSDYGSVVFMITEVE